MAIDFKPYAAVNDHWGDKMPLMACEEMAELIKAISKFERHYDDEYNPKEQYQRQDIITEMADVWISCCALANRYNISEAEVGEAIWRKMDRRY